MDLQTASDRGGSSSSHFAEIGDQNWEVLRYVFFFKKKRLTQKKYLVLRYVIQEYYICFFKDGLSELQGP